MYCIHTLNKYIYITTLYVYMIHHVVTTTPFLPADSDAKFTSVRSQPCSSQDAARRSTGSLAWMSSIQPPELRANLPSTKRPPGKLLKSSCANNIPNWVFCWRSYNFMKWQWNTLLMFLFWGLVGFSIQKFPWNQIRRLESAPTELVRGIEH